MRPPNTQSRNAQIGADIKGPTYSDLSDADVDSLIIKCRRSIHSHRQDSLSSNVGTAEAALAAIESVKGILLDLLAVAPADKRAKIEALIDGA